MIFVDRHKMELPHFFASNERNSLIGEQQRYYDIDKGKRGQKSFKGYRTPKEVKEKLHELFNNKCAYCESKVEISATVTGKLNLSKTKSSQTVSTDAISMVSHFRPRSNARGFKKEHSSVDHYWWLSYEWGNMYLSCRKCYFNKSNWFPVDGARSKLLSDYTVVIAQEENLILDPCNDKVDNFHFEYDFNSGNIKGISKKGRTTVEILGLNREGLVNARKKAIKEEALHFGEKRRPLRIDKTTTKEYRLETLKHWEELINGTSLLDFVGVRRAYLRWSSLNNPNLKEHLFSIRSNYLDFLDENFPEKGIEEAVNLELENTNNVHKEEDESLNVAVNIPEEDISFKELDARQIETKEFIDEEALNIRTLLRNVRIKKIELKNYKCFDSLVVEIPEIDSRTYEKEDEPKEPWLVFLGENGVGKSSLIKAVAMALMGQDYLETLGLDPKKTLKHGKRSGYIKVYGTKLDEVYEVSFNSKKITSNIKEPLCYLLGYGSTRLLPKGSLKPEIGSSYVKSKNLFDYSISLSNAKQWLFNITKDEFDSVASSIKDLLLLNDEDDIKIDKAKKSLYIDYAEVGDRIDIEELSDGYKSVFALTVDIIKTLSLGNLTFKEAEAVVLLDEIGTHLHPRWKMEVVKRLRKTFPRIQFIVTTHEPLCLRGLEKNEVIVLKRNENDKIMAINDLPNPSDFRVDQLLTSEYFGLNSTLDFETEVLFKEYYNLLAKEDRTNEEQNRVSELNQLLPNKKHIGDDIRDELVYYVIDELLAKQVKENGFKMANDEIKQEALDRVKEIWNFIDNND